MTRVRVIQKQKPSRENKSFRDNLSFTVEYAHIRVFLTRLPCRVITRVSVRSPFYCLVSLVGKVPVCCVGGRGSIPGRTNTQGLKIIEEKVLPLL